MMTRDPLNDIELGTVINAEQLSAIRAMREGLSQIGIHHAVQNARAGRPLENSRTLALVRQAIPHASMDDFMDAAAPADVAAENNHFATAMAARWVDKVERVAMAVWNVSTMPPEDKAELRRLFARDIRAELAGEKRCHECNGELSACGEMTADGPRMDCEVCILRAALADRDAAVAELVEAANSLMRRGRRRGNE